ncbi:MAG: ABC transporter ATP-binding protein [Candidatus Rokuibacteriota bacterium]|nr:MAG: ABC transporter ATP-binding protein [Candidatus Rokubacteria bacterium]
MILRLEGIHTYYGLVHMLQGVSLEVERGEVLALLGRNGAGKTTVLKSILGLVPPRAGKVIYKDADITGLAPHLAARRGIAYVPAHRGIFSTLSAVENLEIVRRRSGTGTVEDVFTRFPRLAELRSRLGRHLSGGEQQMLAIGRAIMTNPSLMLLDEPSQGLAPLVLDSIVEMLRGLKRDGLAMLLVEQNVDTAVALADRVVILDQGAKIFEGTPAQLTSDEQIAIRYLGVGV